MTSRRTSGRDAATRDVVFDVSHVTLRFGGVTSLNDVSLQMCRGEILAVIGPNGAGKTSLFNSLTGVYTPQEGAIMLAGRAGRHAGQRARQEDPRHQPPRRGPHVPEHPALPGAHGAGERQGRRRDPAEVRPGLGDARAALAAPGGAREHRRGLRACSTRRRPGGAGQRARRLARLRRAAPAGDRPGARHQPRRPAARRAGGRHQPGREARPRPADPADQQRAQHQRPADRARHEAGHVGRPPASSCSTSARRSPRARPRQIQRNPAVIAAYLGTSRGRGRPGRRGARAAPRSTPTSTRGEPQTR